MMVLYKMVCCFFLAYRMAKTQTPINNMKKNKVPLNNGSPKEFTKDTSKELASAIDPGIIAS